ncbi:CpaF family protein [Caproiciproducens galactitolivorans]|uniref:CpaF family protein n=1 Tax=Caproiciproducens galactitolivorans TaxID=642589 RepID=UPI00240A709E|nr:CpaF family protein [Caproiciproducens galactitolivorans]
MGLLERLEKTQQIEPDNAYRGNQSKVDFDKYAELREKVHQEVIELVNSGEFGNDGDETISSADLLESIQNIVSRQNVPLTRSEQNQVVQEIFDDVAGLGPLESLLRDDTVSEIMVNGARNVYVERGGRIEPLGSVFRDNAQVINVINRIVSSVGRRCDESSPMVDARLRDGSRVNAIIPPLALSGPTITIRKFPKRSLKISDLINVNSLSYPMASFLEACVKGRANIIVSGGTGSGKTTLLNVLSDFIPENERIITIEDSAELQLMQRHVVTLESRPANVEGKGRITIRDLVRNSLRMRPDRIIVGEVRSGETLDMLQAMNTGHDGSLTTAHANSPRDLIGRLETMVLMSGMELPVRAIREQISSALDLIVHQARFRDGSRKIVNISEIVGMEGDVITLQDVFTFREEGYDGNGKIKGRFSPTGIRPHLAARLLEQGIPVRDEWFREVS